MMGWRSRRAVSWFLKDVAGLPQWLLIVAIALVVSGLCFVLLSPLSRFRL